MSLKHTQIWASEHDIVALLLEDTGTVDTASYWQIVNFGIGMHLIVPFLVCLSGISGLFGLTMSILARLCLSKCEPWYI